MCQRLLDQGVSLSIVMNFAQVLKPEELAVLAQFTEVGISIDAVDPTILRSVRKAVDSRTIIFNTLALRGVILAAGVQGPKIIWTGVLSDSVVMNAPQLVAMAAAGGVRHVQYNDLAYFDGMRNRALNVIDMPDEAFSAAVDALEAARRLAAMLGVRFTLSSDAAIDQRLLRLSGPQAIVSRLRRLPSLEWIAPSDRVVVYGAGMAGTALIKALADQSISVHHVIDTYARGLCEGMAIKSLDEYLVGANPNDLILICSGFEDEIEGELFRRGVRRLLKAYGLFRVGFRPRQTQTGEGYPRKGIQGSFTTAGDLGNALQPGLTRLCLSPWSETMLDPKGEVYSCCQRGDVMGIVGRDGDLEAILEGDAYQKLRAGLLTGRGLDPGCSACAGSALCTPETLQKKVAAHLRPSGEAATELLA